MDGIRRVRDYREWSVFVEERMNPPDFVKPQGPYFTGYVRGGPHKTHLPVWCHSEARTVELLHAIIDRVEDLSLSPAEAANR